MERVRVSYDREAATSLLGWWRDAGVDVLVEEDARDWLSQTPLSFRGEGGEPSEAGRGVVRVGALPHTPTPSPQSERQSLPPTLPAFLEWLRDSSDAPEARWGRTRILPAGNPQAELMILTDMPEPGDAEAGMLLSGEIGALFDKMLTAIGHDRSSIWLAPIATVRAIGRVPNEAAQRLTEIARHQIGLVAPKRLLIMGDTPTRALLGAEVMRVRGELRSLNLGERNIETVATFHPRLLHDRPAFKAQAWKDLQLLTKGL